MPAIETTALQYELKSEWTTLQNNIEQYEKTSLAIKLFAIALFASALAVGMNDALSVLLIAVLWLQEGILRTSQSRLGTRILQVEAMLRSSPATSTGPFQLHTEWTAQRAGGVGMIAEYLRNALRPTVMYPYAALLLITIAMALVAPPAVT